MQILKDCYPDNLSPQLLLAILVAKDVYDALAAEFVITSLCDKRHSRTSLHYSGAAVDLRVWTLPEEQRKPAATRIRDRLPDDYDVIFEGDHIHIEYQPKRRDS